MQVGLGREDLERAADHPRGAVGVSAGAAAFDLA
jgi:hypothetical protein